MLRATNISNHILTMHENFPYKNVFITGSTGVVGKKILEKLSELNVKTHALVRSEQGKAIVEEHNAIPIFGDLLDEDLDKKIGNADLVFHVAGVNEMCSKNPSLMFNVNVNGTENIINASNKTNVEAFVYTSSAVTIGEDPGALGIESADHRGKFFSKYEESKYYAEQKAFSINKNFKFVSINPSSVQGPGRTSGTAKILKYVLNSSSPFMIKNNISVVDIDDCANGHLLGATKGLDSERYILNSFYMLSTELIQKLRDLTEWDKRVTYLPKSILRSLGYFGDVYKLFSNSNPLICSESLRVIAHGHKYDGGKAKLDLGLEYKSVDNFIVDTIRWLNNEGIVNIELKQ